MTVDEALKEFALRMGDNALILSHRVSEWCGHAPAPEEDIATANTALDLIGQTKMWLGLAGALDGGKTADQLAYLRDAGAFRNVLLVEQENGDFGRTLMRQFLFDAWHHLALEQLKDADRRVAEIAEKASKEAAYHLERSADLVIRLGDGTDESRRRMQDALDILWPYTGELFEADEADETLAGAGSGLDMERLRADWDRLVGEVLSKATLKAPKDVFMQTGGRRGRHSEHLGYVLADMQFLQRAYPGATW